MNVRLRDKSGVCGVAIWVEIDYVLNQMGKKERMAAYITKEIIEGALDAARKKLLSLSARRG